MRVGVLGSTGFVGANLVDHLTELHIPCIGGSRRIGVDARNVECLIDWIKSNHITHVINLAGDCGGIGLNQKEPGTLWLSAQLVAASVLEAARITGIEKLIMVGTVCSYAKDCPVPFKEDYLMHYGLPEQTNMAYGVAKLSALIGAQAYAKQHGMNICNLIPVNMYGPNDHFDTERSHVIPAIISKIDGAINSGTDTVTLWGTGSATREFLYVKDFARACVAALMTPTTADFINIGTGNEISIRDLANMIAGYMGFTGIIKWDTQKPDGQPRRCLDVTRAKQILNFVAKTKLEDGLRETIEWYRTS